MLDCLHIKLYILQAVCPLSSMDYQISIKLVPLRPIISSRGSVAYGVAKVLTKVLRLLVGKSPHHVQSTSDFVNKAKVVTLQPGEWLTIYDVTSLFTSVPIDPDLNIIKDLLEKDEKLNDRTVLSVQNIIELWGSVCLILTFLFKINSISRLKELLWGLQ